MDALRVGVVGLGVVAQVVYLPLLARRWDMFQVAAVCDLDRDHAEEVGRGLGARAYGDPAEMLDAGGVDAVLVLTPGCHGALVRAALERGHWVLCEKPLAYSRAEVRDLAAAGEARLMVGYMKQYDPAVQRLLECLHEVGGPECVRHLDVTVLHPSGESQRLFARARASGSPRPERIAPYLEAAERSVTAAVGTAPERLRRLYSEVLLGSVSHELALMRLFAEPSPGPSPWSPQRPFQGPFQGSARPHRGQDSRIPPTVDHVAVWPPDAFPPSIEVTGALPGTPAAAGRGRYGLRWHYLPSYPAYHESVTLHHEHGSLELLFPSPYLLNAPTRLSVRSRVGTTERTMVFLDVAEAFERQLVAFHRFVTQDEPPLTGLGGALRDIVAAQRIIRAYAGSTGTQLGGECAEEAGEGTGGP